MKLGKNHTVDLLFPVALLFVFASSAIIVLLLAAGIYKSSAESSALNYSSGTSLAYVSEKLHQGNRAGAIRIDEIEGKDVLVIDEEHEGVLYQTMIYFDDGSLRELFIKADADVSLSAGKPVMELASFDMEALSDSLLKFSCEDEKGHVDTQLIHIY